NAARAVVVASVKGGVGSTSSSASRRVALAIFASFPTRRSSDLHRRRQRAGGGRDAIGTERDRKAGRLGQVGLRREAERAGIGPRSEEHTSELQSLTKPVCRLLLDKEQRGATFD